MRRGVQEAGRGRFLTSEAVWLVGPCRDGGRRPLKPSAAQGRLYLSACEPRVVPGGD